MSEVTTVVLVFSGHEEDSLDVPPPAVAAIQAWLRNADVGQLNPVEHLFGGWKAPGVRCFGGGFNHLDADSFAAVFRDQEWRHPEQVVLMLTTEEASLAIIRPG
jgi:hypothetical protein